MSKISFENYGIKAKNSNSFLHIASRFEFMGDSEKFTVNDIIEKLKLQPTDTLLDIGSGTGNLTIPLMSYVSSVSCIDHVNCLQRLKSRLRNVNNISFFPGNFLDLNIKQNYDKILCYSVLHYLTNREEVWNFIEKVLQLLKPGGSVLFGDIPNSSKKDRFLKTSFGKKIDTEYRKSFQISNKKREVSYQDKLILDKDLVEFNDNFVLEILKKTRENGFHSYVIDQPSNLCLGYTREDILILNPEG